MSDRIYVILAFIGFCILSIVVIKNYNGSQEFKEFGANTYYTPNDVREYQESAIDLYGALTGQRLITCPVPQMPKFNGSILRASNFTQDIDNINTSYYAMTCFFIPSYAMTDNRTLSTAGEVTLTELGMSNENAYVEILAPFTYKFLNINTDGDTIIIINSKNNCKITFNGVANWFCAGNPSEYPTQTLGSGTNQNIITWDKHGSNHSTIIGATTNATVTGGTAMDIIGYADASTTVTIEGYYEGSWHVISVSDWITTGILDRQTEIEEVTEEEVTEQVTE